MLILDVIFDGKTYRLPDTEHENKTPRLYIIRKGINHIFKSILEKHPGHCFAVRWDEDLKEINYASETIPHETITEELNASHGKLF